LTAARERARKELAVKLKNPILWLCIVVILVGEFFLFSANRMKDAALVRAREAELQVTNLQSQLDQLKNSSVATLNAENARLRKENQGLSQKNSQLQNENSQLRGTNQQLTLQLQTTRDTVRQQQEQLQEMQMESQPVSPAPEPSTEPSLSALTQLNACVNNLRQIDMAKQQWALENKKTADAVPTAQDLLPYFSDRVFPVCPSGGIYTINAVGELPTCSIPGHALPQ
jgi:myosin heavy subunit